MDARSMVRRGSELRVGKVARALRTVLAASVAAAGTSALAATITVNTTADMSPPVGACSLRMALDNINDAGATHSECVAIGAYGTADRIAFDTSVFPQGTAITVASPMPLKASTVTTIDAGLGGVAIDGGGASELFHTYSGSNAVLKALTIRNGFVSNINSGGGIDNEGTLTLDYCTLSGNKGGYGAAIYNRAGATLTLSHSTVSGNAAHSCAGIMNYGSATLTDSTVAGNSAVHSGGGVCNGGNLTVTNSTISGNSAATSGGGIYRGSLSATTSLTNTIVSNSRAGGNCSVGVVDLGGNIDDGTSCGFTAGAGSFPNTNPLLGSLGNNGGPTATKMPALGSPAINAVSCANAPIDDQRTVPRPQPNGGMCDIGAVERLAVEDSVFLETFEGY